MRILQTLQILHNLQCKIRNTDDLLTMNMMSRQGRMLEEISGMYSSVFGTKVGPALSFLFQAGPFLFAFCFISFFYRQGLTERSIQLFSFQMGQKRFDICSTAHNLGNQLFTQEMSKLIITSFKYQGVSTFWPDVIYGLPRLCCFSYQLCCQRCKQHQQQRQQ